MSLTLVYIWSYFLSQLIIVDCQTVMGDDVYIMHSNKNCFLHFYLRVGGGGHWLVRMEWHPARWSVCLPLLIFPCTINSRSSLLAPAHPGGPGKRAVKWLWWWCGGSLFRVTWVVLSFTKQTNWSVWICKFKALLESHDIHIHVCYFSQSPK